MEIKELLKICDEYSWMSSEDQKELIKLAEGQKGKITIAMETFLRRLAVEDIQGVQAMLDIK